MFPTQTLRDIVQSENIPTLFFHGRWTAFPAGLPIIQGKQLLGGIGSGGGAAYSTISVARAALRVGGLSTEDANAILKELMKAKNMLAKGQLL